MDYKKLSFGLGVFSLAIAAAELFGSKKIAEQLDAEGHEGLIKGFGARELIAGVNLVANPAVATSVWNRVAGDVMDIVATAQAAKHSPRNKATWGALAFVLGAAALDVWTAIGLDKQTGKTLPSHEPLPS
jgi:UDP-glucose 4-epimerase